MSRRSRAAAAPDAMAKVDERPPRGRWNVLLIVLAVGLAFGSVVRNGAAPFDDQMTIFGNARLNPPRWTGDGVLWFWSHAELSLYVPLTYTAWALLAAATYVPTPDAAGRHLDPHVFHAASLAAHLANVLLVYALLRQLLIETKRQPDNPWPAAAGALLYGLHPLQVEAVAWASGLKDLLYVTCAVSSVILYLRSVSGGDEPGRTRSSRRAAYVAGLLLVPIGMLCKPTAMVAPLVAAALDGLILRRPMARVARSAGPYLLAAVPLAIVAKLAQPAMMVVAVPLAQRPIVAGASLTFYLYKLLVPLNLGFDYGWRPFILLARPWFRWLALAPVPIIIALWWDRRRCHWLAAGGAVFVIGLLPVLGLVPFDYQVHSTVADHYLVLSMLGPAILVAGGLASVPPRARRAVGGICAVMLLLLGAGSAMQMRFWRDGATIARHTLAVNPASANGHGAMAYLSAFVGDKTGAEREFLTAERLNPQSDAAYQALALLYSDEDRPGDAIAQLRQAATNAGDRPDALLGLLRRMEHFATVRGAADDARRYREEAERVQADARRPHP